MEVLFYSEQHRNFYNRYVDGGADPYYRALVYLLGMTAETRSNFSRCFDAEARIIRPAALEEGWQTGGTVRIMRMAFNLWNGWCYHEQVRKSSLWERTEVKKLQVAALDKTSPLYQDSMRSRTNIPSLAERSKGHENSW